MTFLSLLQNNKSLVDEFKRKTNEITKKGSSTHLNSNQALESLEDVEKVNK